MNRITTLLMAAGIVLSASAQTKGIGMAKYESSKIVKEELVLTQEWDKVFPKSNKVDHKKVTFVNRYGITLAADMYTPKSATGRSATSRDACRTKGSKKLSAIAVAGPFGAVKEQSSGLYAQQLAERGFLTIAFDPSFTGESGGQPRYMASPDINMEDFLAAVDFLSVQENVDAERIGILGVCGCGGIAIQAAALDPRIKATVASTMYDMTRVAANGYFDADDSADKRNAARKAMAKERTENYRAGQYVRGGGVVEVKTDDLPWFVKQYFDYYKTPRGYHKRSLNSNGGWNTIGTQSFMNFHFLDYAEEIKNAVMVLHGDKAHSFYFGQTAFSRLRGTNKEFVVISGATHCDLYDQLDKIPFDRLAEFYNKNMQKQ